MPRRSTWLWLPAENADFADQVEKRVYFHRPESRHHPPDGDKVCAIQSMKAAGSHRAGPDGPLTDDTDRTSGNCPRHRLPGHRQGGGGGGARHARGAQRGRPAQLGAGDPVRGGGRLRPPTWSIWKIPAKKPRHVEIQVLADGQGNAVHWGPRLLTAAPSPESWRRPRAGHSRRCAGGGGGILRQGLYRHRLPGAGTFEFLYEDGGLLFHRNEHPRRWSTWSRK